LLKQSISHLLEHYTLGEMFSNKNGVCCYPATDNRTGIRYIAKIQTFPYSPSVTEAFFLSGAFSNIDDIDAYYQDLAKDMCRQAAILNALSHYEYFSHFSSCEMEKRDEVGYDVCLISPYCNTLATLFQKIKFNQEQVLDLGISLCRGLALCREAGFLYTGLKPENIYISDRGQFMIGDVGFIPFSSLPYAALPQSRYTVYTPSDCHDCFSRIPENLDVYGVGIILYQACFDGKYPVDRAQTPQSVCQELADIILTACSPIADKRWRDPTEMENKLLSCKENTSKG